MFSIVLCDDNQGFLTLFKSVVNKEFYIKMQDTRVYRIAASFGCGADLLEYSKSNSIDVLFLDIDMPEMTGFEVAKAIKREHGNTLIIFMSAYDNFVYESFDYLPFAYIRKDKIEEDITKVVSRICDKLMERTRYVTLYDKRKEIIVDLREIMYFESTKNYYVAYLSNGKTYSCRGTLTSLEDDMKPFGFFRTHHAFLVNLEYAEQVEDTGCILVGENKVPIAQKRSREFKTAFLEFTRRHAGI